MDRHALALMVAIAVTSACGGGNSPTAPTPPPAPATTNIAGNWSGTFTYNSITGARIVSAVTASFTQASQNITAQVNFQDSSRMTVSGVVSGSTLTASVQFNLASAPQCAGTASVSGTASTSQVRFTVPSLASAPGCLFFTNGEIVLNR